MLWFAVASASAGTYFFIPGDASFGARAPEFGAASATLELSLPLLGGGAICGFYGYDSLTVKDVPVPLWQALQAAVNHAQAKESTNRTPVGGLGTAASRGLVLVYVLDASVDVTTIDYGARYNEDIDRMVIRNDDGQPDAKRTDPAIQEERARVPALKVLDRRPVSLGGTPMPSAVVRAADTQFLIVSAGDDLRRNEPDASLTGWNVAADGTTRVVVLKPHEFQDRAFPVACYGACHAPRESLPD